MPWVLIGLGIIVIASGFLLRLTTSVTSRTIEQTTTAAPSATSEDRAGPAPTVATTTQNKTSTTEGPPPDSLLTAEVGLGGALILGGAFYARITKISFPGGSIEMAAITAAARSIRKAIQNHPELNSMSPADIATATLEATGIAASRGIQLARLRKLSPSQIARVADIGVSPEEVEALKTTGRTPPQLWDRLAEAALDEVLPRTTR